MNQYLKNFKTLTINTLSDLGMGTQSIDIECIRGSYDLIDIIDKYGVKEFNNYNLTTIEFKDSIITVTLKR
jgi:hypothetical protein